MFVEAAADSWMPVFLWGCTDGSTGCLKSNVVLIGAAVVLQMTASALHLQLRCVPDCSVARYCGYYAAAPRSNPARAVVRAAPT
jgi:hypothetical protein